MEKCNIKEESLKQTEEKRAGKKAKKYESVEDKMNGGVAKVDKIAGRCSGRTRTPRPPSAGAVEALDAEVW